MTWLFHRPRLPWSSPGVLLWLAHPYGKRLRHELISLSLPFFRKCLKTIFFGRGFIVSGRRVRSDSDEYLFKLTNTNLQLQKKISLRLEFVLLQMVNACWWFYFSKFVELLDTVCAYFLSLLLIPNICAYSLCLLSHGLLIKIINIRIIIIQVN